MGLLNVISIACDGRAANDHGGTLLLNVRPFRVCQDEMSEGIRINRLGVDDLVALAAHNLVVAFGQGFLLGQGNIAEIPPHFDRANLLDRFHLGQFDRHGHRPDLGALVGLIAALLGAIAIWTAVTGELRERRSEIGVLSAMGAGGGRIFLLFLPKMALVGIVGGALGWGAGTALAVWAGPALAGLGPDVPVLVLIGLLPWAMVSGFLLALAAGGAAIWRAVRIDPVDALREL